MALLQSVGNDNSSYKCEVYNILCNMVVHVRKKAAGLLLHVWAMTMVAIFVTLISVKQS